MTVTAADAYLLYLINNYRADPNRNDPNNIAPGQSLAPLAFNDLLDNAAQSHSDWLMANNVFSHTGANGSSVENRIDASGYQRAFLSQGENLAASTTAGFDLPALMERAFEGWRTSSGHNSAMLQADAREAGLGMSVGNFPSLSPSGDSLVTALKFGKQTSDSPFVTGVAYRDANGNGRYDYGEGVTGLDVKVWYRDQNSADVTGEGGDFSLGTYRSSPALTYTVIVNDTWAWTVDVGTQNVDGSFVVPTGGRTGTLARHGTAGNDYIDGSPWEEAFFGGDGDDSLDGWAGNDIFDGGNGSNVLYGGAGYDTAIVHGVSENVLFQRGSGNAWDGGDRLDYIDPNGAFLHQAHNVEQFNLQDGIWMTGADSAGMKVARLYEVALGRDADANGLNYWIDQLQAGTPLNALATGFLTAPEFTSQYGGLNDGDFVNQLYQNALGRNADPGGFSYWTGLLSTGSTRADVLEGFSNAPEYINNNSRATQLAQGIFDPDETAASIGRLYKAGLGRDADAGGLVYWIGQLNGGGTLDQIADGFLGSTEFQSRYPNQSVENYVDTLYQNVLGRPGDPGGRAFWIDELNSGRQDRGDVLNGFAQAPEFQIAMAPAYSDGIDVL